MSTFHLYLFGSPRLERDGVAVKISRCKALALLSYLAATGKAHARDSLATLFWPDYGQSEARVALSRHLYDLNKILVDDVLVLETESVALGDDFWLDVAEFTAVLGAHPTVTARDLAPSAVALVQTGWAVMRSLGPAIGGFLILWFGPAGNFFVQAGAYALVILTVMKLSLPYEKPDVGKARSRGTFREGWAYIASEPTTRAFLFMSWVLPLFIIPNFNALPPIYAKDIFAGGPDTLGVLLSAVGIGGIAGGFVTASLGKQERRGCCNWRRCCCSACRSSLLP